jgi:hypothetical protein
MWMAYVCLSQEGLTPESVWVLGFVSRKIGIM